MLACMLKDRSLAPEKLSMKTTFQLFYSIIPEFFALVFFSCFTHRLLKQFMNYVSEEITFFPVVYDARANYIIFGMLGSSAFAFPFPFPFFK